MIHRNRIMVSVASLGLAAGLGYAIAGIESLAPTSVVVTLSSGNGTPTDSWIEVVCVGQSP
jgi:hypothetical protein